MGEAAPGGSPDGHRVLIETPRHLHPPPLCPSFGSILYFMASEEQTVTVRAIRFILLPIPLAGAAMAEPSLTVGAFVFVTTRSDKHVYKRPIYKSGEGEASKARNAAVKTK